MKSKKLIFILFFLIFLSGTSLNSKEQFTFEVAEIEISNEGNLFKGLKRGNATSTDGNLTITADTFEYDRTKNILVAKGNVILKDKIKNYLIESNHITYYKNNEKIFSKDKTRAFFQNKYEIFSSDVELDKNTNIINTDKKTTIIDENYTEYETDTFNYKIDNNLFKGKNIKITTNTNKKNIEKEFYNFKDGIFDLNNKEFVASDTRIFLKKNSFDKEENDPRIYGNSSKKIKNLTKLNKAIFTSCKINNNGCPPWSIKAKNITHDQNKQDIIYEHSVLHVYDFPVFYFPKFTHPDPSVRRRGGFLQPSLNSSDILGSSLSLPYFYTMSNNADITFKPTIFDSEIEIYRGEYRQSKENSNFIGDFGITNGYAPKNEEKNTIGHIFSKFKTNLGFENFRSSLLEISFQKINRDTFLKVFDTNLSDINENLKPNPNKLESSIKLSLNHQEFNLDTGFLGYETLSGSNNDRYQYILPYYNFSKDIIANSLINLNFYSSGNNSLNETNKLKTEITNDFVINSVDFFSDKGFKNNFEFYLKNLNSLGKNLDQYKSSPQSELRSILNLETSLPLIKSDNKFTDILTPKISLRTNPNDMKNYSNAERTINVDNIFYVNRLGLDNTIEEGTSLTFGIDYRKENLNDINRYFEIKLAGIVRDTEQKKIPVKSGISQKNSNLFGSMVYSMSKNIDLNYIFSIDNDLSTFEQNSIGASFDLNKFSTSVNFTDTEGKLGNTSTLENSFKFNFDENNALTYRTRRNREINLTEYYDLVYEYKNDCLTAGVKYKKSYYRDRDLKPSENLLFTISFFPLTQYEQKIDDSIYKK